MPTLPTAVPVVVHTEPDKMILKPAAAVRVMQTLDGPICMGLWVPTRAGRKA